MPDVIIRSETEQDYDAIREIHRSAFHRADEGNLVDNLREMRELRGRKVIST